MSQGIYRANQIIYNPNINDITMTTDDEAISNECIYDLIINFTKSLRIIKKRCNCSSIRDYISKLLSNSDITKEVILNYLTDNNKIKNKPTNGRNSYYIIDEIPLPIHQRG